MKPRGCGCRRPLLGLALDLGQVEVLKGVASALYGASALRGVINFVSRRPDGAHDVLLNQTSRGGTDAGLWWASDPFTQGYAYSLIANVDRQASEDINGDGWADMPRVRRAVIRPRLYWADGSGAEMFLTVGAMLEDRSGGTVKDGRVPVGDPTGTAFVEALKTQRFDLGLNGHWPIAEDRTLTNSHRNFMAHMQQVMVIIPIDTNVHEA